ncbi:MAG: prepilin-type N-terminal cleavage/methylation domain-containing protein [Gemmatimonadales bacterium]|nr:MAG: prepilin-type N-terminal cleavage/methylation domain-containing protein [Gemmatimonadales bacterium]
MNKKGFTLIELLIVVVIIGILAAIAIPRFGATRERAFQSAVVSDLRNLQTVQEQWYADPANNYEYATLGDLEGANLFRASQGVDVTITVSDSDQGFLAVGTHTALDEESCAVTVGDGAENSVDDEASAGEIACTWQDSD